MGNTKKELRLIFISDTHTYHDKIKLPKCDILVHAGDYSFIGSIPEVNKFMTWFSEQDCSYRVCINGNHEKMFWKNPNLFMSLIPKNVIFLLDNQVEIEGLNFYGSPHTKEFCSWAYPYFNEQEAEVIWNKIPDDTDILITHMPAYKMHDGAPYKVGRNGLLVPSLDEGGEPVGCKVLKSRIEKVKPLIHVAGHIHEGAGYTETKETLFINASVCDGKYKPINPITVVDIDVKTKTIIRITRE